MPAASALAADGPSRTIAALVLAAGVVGGCARSPASAAPSPAIVPPARPPTCRVVPAGSDLQKLVDAAASGDALCLEPGSYSGPLDLEKAVTLWGPSDAVIRSTGTGTTVLVRGGGARLAGFAIDGSGHRFDTLDAALHVLSASDVTVDGLVVRHATFGVLVEKSRRVTVRRCEVEGSGNPALGLRGDAIRLWETFDSDVLDNRVVSSRDVVVWYSDRNRVAGNVIEDGRYGTHLMYSHHNVLEHNRYRRDVVGVFLMYSRHVQVRANLFADCAGAAGMGLGTKESGDLTIAGNDFVRDEIGLYLDTTPLSEDDRDLIRGNTLRLCDTGVLFHGPAARNRFEGNVFRDVRANVRVDGGADAMAARFEGNDFDDYAGYDLDGDGYGDLPYEERSLASDLERDHPELAFFEGTPALALVEAVGRALPLFEPKLVLRDPRPRVGPLHLGGLDAR